MNTRLTIVLAVLLAFSVVTAAHAITIVPTYVDGAGATWDSTKKGVIGEAIAEWQALLPDSQTVSVTLDFTHAGKPNYLGQWNGSYSAPDGTDVYPWTTGVTHTVHFNVDYFTGTNYTWWDPSPAAGGDQPFAAWDALSVARHEFGHMLGFTDGFYMDNFHTGQEFDKWDSHITGTTFDPGGLNVTMDAIDDLGHVSNSGSTAGDLMVPALVNNARHAISTTDLNMLHLAYNYTLLGSTTYTLSAAAGKTAMHKGDSTSITATITNSGTGTVDSLDFTGLRATATSGTIGGSSTTGGPLAKAGGTASNTGLTYTNSTAGTYSITPAITTATNHWLGSNATLATTTPVIVTVYSGQGVWNFATSGNWLDSTKWTTAGGVPGIDGALSAADTAAFSKTLTGSITVNLNTAAPRLAGLTLDLTGTTGNFTLAPGTGGTLTMQASTEALISSLHGLNNTISAPIVLGSDTRISGAAPINFTGGITGIGKTLTVTNTITASSIQVDTLRINGLGTYAVPEPSAFVLLGTVAAGLFLRFRRRS